MIYRSVGICSCIDSHGRSKNLYSSKEEALSTADYRRSCGGVELRAYPCPDDLGWHLTKRPNDWE
jgi:hypothetical protein